MQQLFDRRLHPCSAAALGGRWLEESLSPLSLFHPDGASKRTSMMGSGCPPALRVGSPTVGSSDFDLVILAPTVKECRTAAWLEKTITTAAQELAADGVVYVCAPRRWRRRIARLLQRSGLSLEHAMLHLPDFGSSRCIVPLAPIPLRYALSQLTRAKPWKRHLVVGACKIVGSRALLSALLPSVGFIARHECTRPAFNWLFEADGDTPCEGSAIALKSSAKDSLVLFRFSDRYSSPTAVVKIAGVRWSGSVDGSEASNLRRLGQSARRAGATVPAPLLTKTMDNFAVLFETVVHGRSAAMLLAVKPNRLRVLLERIVSWLEEWNRSTRVIKTLDQEWFQKNLITPAVILAPFIEGGEEYQRWLIMRCSEGTGISMPFVAAHNDLTMWNVLFDEDENLGIVDWEAAGEERLPLLDFFYAVTDAVAAVSGYTNRVEAFEACFAICSAYTELVKDFLTRLRTTVGVPAEVVDLCFHACWLHHGINEHKARESSSSTPFLKILRSLVRNRLPITQSLRS